MSILTRFLLGRFLRILLFSLVTAVVVFLIVDLIENLDRFLERNVAIPIIAQAKILISSILASILSWVVRACGVGVRRGARP